MSSINRRRFVTTTLQAGAVAGLAFLRGLPPAVAAGPESKTVHLHPDVEPLVRLIEETPRADVLTKVADRIRGGTSYQQLLSAVFLAGVRGIQPRPVGFKFHAVLVINSAHQAAQAATDNDRWLPLFWAVDNYKVSQAENKKQGDWSMAAPDEKRLPSPENAKKAFVEAMDNWDVAAADRAVTAFGRTAGAGEVIELFWRYGARDFRDIGHKAIYVANGWRTMNAIGWRHAEPFLRSLTYALLEHEGENPAKRNADADRPGRENIKLAAELAKIPVGGKRTPEAATEMLAAIREAGPLDAAKKAGELLKKGVHPASVWDGLFLGAGELLARQPGIVGLHCVTSVNALYHGYDCSGDETTRRFLMLQAASFLTMFRGAMKSRGKISDLKLDTMEPAEAKGSVDEQIYRIFTAASKDRTQAAREALALLQQDPAHIGPLMKVARQLIFTKGTNSHDYKFSSAALEDFHHVSPAWRARFAASSLFNLKGSGDKDNPLIGRTRAALVKG